jgi:hypothetical protein
MEDASPSNRSSHPTEPCHQAGRSPRREGDTARAAPAVLSTEDLLEQVWDENADPFTNAVFVTLSRLRRKLGEPAVIETQPGVGYRIPPQCQ